MSGAAGAAAAERLRDELEHYDPSQLWFQLQEIVVDSGYLKHGLELGSGDVVLDVGANVGVAAAFFASVCEVAAVHCFEPVPQSYELLARNLGRYPACTPHPYGLGREAGAAEFTFYRGSAAMSGQYADPEADRALVRAAMLNLGTAADVIDTELAGRYMPEPVTGVLRTLASVLAELGLDRVDLLKVDVEKAELDVLAGIGERDWPSIRQLVVEVHDIDGRLAALSGELRGRGFEVVTDQTEAFRGTAVHTLFAAR